MMNASILITHYQKNYMAELTPKFTGEVIHGKMTLEQPEKLQKWLGIISKEDGTPQKVSVVVKKFRKIASNEQMRYYRGVIVKMVAEKLGMEYEDAHNMLRMMHLLDHTKQFPFPRSTTDLSTVEFEDYNRECRQWAAKELQLYVPLPNEVELDYDIINV